MKWCETLIYVSSAAPCVLVCVVYITTGPGWPKSPVLGILAVQGVSKLIAVLAQFKGLSSRLTVVLAVQELGRLWSLHSLVAFCQCIQVIIPSASDSVSSIHHKPCFTCSIMLTYHQTLLVSMWPINEFSLQVESSGLTLTTYISY